MSTRVFHLSYRAQTFQHRPLSNLSIQFPRCVECQVMSIQIEELPLVLVKDRLSRGVSTSRSTPYHPIGHGQVERYNGIIWKAVRLPVQQWEKVLPDVLHSTRSLLSTATNATPHDRFFNFARKSSQGISLLSWLSPGPVLLRKFVCSQ